LEGFGCRLTVLRRKEAMGRTRTGRQDFTEEGDTEMEHIVTEFCLGQSVGFHVCVRHQERAVIR
jgi:hypothetical protein